MSSERERHFEGLRGLSALIVVNEHYMSLFYGLSIIDFALRVDTFGVIENLSYPPFNLLHNGAAAVCIFFVLSGYVLSYRYFGADKEIRYSHLFAAAIKRYFRLCIPIIACLLLFYVAFRCGLVFFDEVAVVAESHMLPLVTDPPMLVNILRQGFVQTIFLGDANYNPPLWTMAAEFYGSLVVFVLQFILMVTLGKRGGLAIRLSAYVASILLLYFYVPETKIMVEWLSNFLVAFILGMCLCDLKHHNNANRYLEKGRRFWVPLALLLGVILLAYMVRGYHTGFYRWLTYHAFDASKEYVYNTWGAFLLIAAIEYSPRVKAFLNNSMLQQLGSISFSLYLTHYIILASVSCGLFLALDPSLGYGVRVGIASFAGLIISFLVALIFTRYVDKLAIRCSHFIGNSICASTTLNQSISLDDIHSVISLRDFNNNKKP